jgi:hypothetical protein
MSPVRRPSASRRDILAVCVCLLLAIGFTVQAIALLGTVRGGVDYRARVLRHFLGQADRVIPANASFASNVFGSGYMLYPRERRPAKLGRSPEKLRAGLEHRGVRYLVLHRPLPRSLARSSWATPVYSDPDGVVLNVH